MNSAVSQRGLPRNAVDSRGLSNKRSKRVAGVRPPPCSNNGDNDDDNNDSNNDDNDNTNDTNTDNNNNNDTNTNNNNDDNNKNHGDTNIDMIGRPAKLMDGPFGTPTVGERGSAPKGGRHSTICVDPQ